MCILKKFKSVNNIIIIININHNLYIIFISIRIRHQACFNKAPGSASMDTHTQRPATHSAFRFSIILYLRYIDLFANMGIHLQILQANTMTYWFKPQPCCF